LRIAKIHIQFKTPGEGRRGRGTGREMEILSSDPFAGSLNLPQESQENKEKKTERKK